MNNEEFSSLIKKRREKFFSKPYELAYKAFVDLKYNEMPEDYFMKNASEMIEQMRDKCWQFFLEEEKHFCNSIYKEIASMDNYSGLDAHGAVDYFIENNSDKFYILSLSNTQSRRSRSGSEFECIIELILMGAGIPIDCQASLSSGIFQEHNLGKAVDLVSPGVIEYSLQKRQCSLISCKTTLRERWAEVVEEKNRTGASEIFLPNLDEKISKKIFKNLNDNNIIPVVTKKIKHEKYKDNNTAITYEEMIESIIQKVGYWNREKYTAQELLERLNLLQGQAEKHLRLKHYFVSGFYEKIINHMNK